MTTPLQRHLAQMRGMKCFVCAPAAQNPGGLNLEFAETADGAKAPLLIRDEFQSYPGVVHGGVLSAILDETMAYAILFKAGRLPFTTSLKVDFRLPIKTETPYEVEADMVSRTGDKFCMVARVKDARGRSVVQAEAEFVIPVSTMAKRLVPNAEWEGFEQYLGG